MQPLTTEQQQLVESQTKTARRIATERHARCRRSTLLTLDEFLSEAAIALCRAAIKWTPENQRTWPDYASLIVKQRIRDMVRKARAVAMRTAGRGNLVEARNDPPYEEPEEIEKRKDLILTTYAHVVAGARGILGDELYELFSMLYLERLPVYRVRDLTGYTLHRIAWMRQRALAKLRRSMDADAVREMLEGGVDD